MQTIDGFFGFDPVWQMDNSERLALLAILNHLKPELSLEIGSKAGGSLAQLSAYSRRVISMDIDPTVPSRLGRFTNVEFVTGDSRVTLPALLKRLSTERAPLRFALIDGDHTAEGVRADCAEFLRVRPTGPLVLLMHDSFNPDVRTGIARAGWRECPYVHALEMDLIPGVISAEPRLRRQMWGGFALALMGPEERSKPLDISAAGELSYRTTRRFSVHNVMTRRILQTAWALGGGKRAAGNSPS